MNNFEINYKPLKFKDIKFLLILSIVLLIISTCVLIFEIFYLLLKQWHASFLNVQHLKILFKYFGNNMAKKYAQRKQIFIRSNAI